MIYSAWVGTGDEWNKGQSNYNEFAMLEKKYRISHMGVVTEDEENYDVIVGCINRGYANNRFKVYKNDPKLSTLELALICDHGNLCFGYRYDGDIVIYTD